MVVPYKGSYLTVNPNAYFHYHFCLEEKSERRRSLFKKGIFKVEEDVFGFQLLVNDKYVGCWKKHDTFKAQDIIDTAYNTYTSMGGKI